MIRHVIFDLDGTLVDSCRACVCILNAMLAERGSKRQIDEQRARAFVSQGGTAMVRALLEDECRDDATDLAEFRRRYSMFGTPVTDLYPGVRAGLASLRDAGLSLAICTNKPQNLCEAVLRDTGLSQLFDCVIGGREGLRSKPDPDLLGLTLDRLGASSGECLFAGDSEIDYETARSFGMPFLFAAWGYAQPGWQPRFGQTCECFGDLARIVLDQAEPRESCRHG